MTRMQQARHLAITDSYWRAYVDGLEDRHRVRDTEPGTWDAPSASIAEITARHQQRAPRRETWDSDWGPVPEPSSTELLTNMARRIAATGHPAPKETR